MGFRTRREFLKAIPCSALVASSLGASPKPAAHQLADPMDPRGPIRIPGMKVVVGDSGMQTDAYIFSDHIPQHTPWRAKWIWLNSEAPQDAARGGGREKPVAACFRKEILLPETPTRVLAWVSAGLRYRLYVNGTLVSRGPADAGTDYDGPPTGLWFYEQRDLTPFFRNGKNAVAVEVFVEKLGGWYGWTGDGGLLFEAELTFPNQTRLTLQTDPSWRGNPAEYFQMASVSLPDNTDHSMHLRYLPSKEPVGWRESGFNDSAWREGVVVDPLISHLVPSQIPPPMEGQCPALRLVRASEGVRCPEKPFHNGQAVTFTSDGSFAIQFDRILAGYVGIKIKGGEGATLTIAPNEKNEPGGHRLATMLLGKGVQFFELPFLTSFTVINIAAAHVTSPVEIQDVRANFASYPVAYRGSFTCSDESLNRIWQVARWATQICMQDYYLDSPDHQEPLGDFGDYLIEALVSDYAFGDSWLIRQDLRKFAAILEKQDYHNFHTSYALLWVQALLDYYDHTGDKTLVEELAPRVHALLRLFESYRGKNGLISEAPNYMFMDWVTIAGFTCHHPPAVIGQGYMTAFYYRALADGERIAGITADRDQAAKYGRVRQEVAAAFHSELWNAEKGLYRDGKPFQTSVQPNRWLPEDRDIVSFSPHVNTLAVLYGLAPREQQTAIVEKMLAEQPLNCTPYFMHFVFCALAHAGLFGKYGTDQIRRWKIVSESQSFHEMWTSGDLSHGWCSSPLFHLSSQVLGATPADPGFKEISIRPVLCDLKWARGTVPTPHGDVKVSWVLMDRALRMDVSVPQGAKARVALPIDRFKTPNVAANGRTIWSNNAQTSDVKVRRTSWTIEVSVPAGSYHFVMTEGAAHEL